jgi:type IV secretory pathway VirB9-like protein
MARFPHTGAIRVVCPSNLVACVPQKEHRMLLERATAVLVSSLVTCGPLLAQTPAARPDTRAIATSGTRQVRVTSLTVVPIQAHLRFSTLIVLPASERILEAHCGDKEFWQVSVSAVEHIASIKPSRPGASTNINLFTANGNVYSFTVTEVSQVTGAAADLKVFVEPDQEMLAAAQGTPKYVPYSEVEAQEERATAAIAEAQATVDRALTEYPAALRFVYRFERNRAPFWIEQIWHDHQQTYVRTRANELPALYEVRDGKPSLVQFTVRGQNVYVVPKVLDAGYLAIGNKRTEFRRES